MSILPTARAIPLAPQNQQDAAAEQSRSSQLGTEVSDEDHLSNLLFQDRQPVTSSNIDSFAYDEKANRLYIWFRYVPRGTEEADASTTTLYVYSDVNPVDVFEFTGSDSQGIYFQNVMRKRYPGSKIGGNGGGGATIGTYRPDLTYAQAVAQRRRAK